MVSLKFQRFQVEVKFGELESLGKTPLMILEGLWRGLSAQMIGKGTGLGVRGILSQLELLQKRGLYSFKEKKITKKGSKFLLLDQLLRKINREGLWEVVLDLYSEKLRLFDPAKLERRSRYPLYPPVLGEIKLTQKIELGKKEFLKEGLEEVVEELEGVSHYREVARWLVRESGQVEISLRPVENLYYNWSNPQFQFTPNPKFPVGLPVGEFTFHLRPIVGAEEFRHTLYYRKLEKLLLKKQLFYNLVTGEFLPEGPRREFKGPFKLAPRKGIGELPPPNWEERVPLQSLLFCQVEGRFQQFYQQVNLPIEEKLEELAEKGGEDAGD
ncbi:MAG: hypothetical protein ABGW77_02765 [Campylobacterales bacterium]